MSMELHSAGPILKPLGLYCIEVTLKLHASGTVIVRKWLVLAQLPGLECRDTSY